MSKFKIQWILHIAYNLLRGFSETPCLASMLANTVWKREREISALIQNLLPSSEAPRTFGKNQSSVLITVTAQTHGYQVILSWPRFWLQTEAHSIPDNMLKVKRASSPLLLPCKVYEFCSFVKKPKLLKISRLRYPSTHQHADGKIWRGRKMKLNVDHLGTYGMRINF